MLKTIRNAWKLPDLRNKLLFVVFALLIFRLGAAIPVPYINTEYLQQTISANSGTIFGLLNTLSGSALSRSAQQAPVCGLCSADLPSGCRNPGPLH